MNKDFLNAVNKLNTVIIPGLGAVMKMGKKYSFNSFLNYDDGRFVKYVQEETNISLEDAKIKVDSWYSDIKSSLETKGSFNLKGIGEIKKLDDGKLDFSINIVSKKKSIDNQGKQDKKQEQIEDTKQEQEEVKKQVEQESQILNTIKNKEKEDNLKKEEVEDIKDEITVPQFKLDDEDEDPVIEALIEGAERIETENRKNKFNRILIFSGLILFIVGGALVGYLKYDSIVSYIKADDIQLISKMNEEEIENNIIEESKNKEDAELNITINDNDISKADSADIVHTDVIAVEKLEIKKQPKPLLDNSKNKYHIVVGTFGKINNANRLVNELISKGFTEVSVLKTKDELHCVKLGSYKSKSKAKEILLKSKLDGWVKYY